MVLGMGTSTFAAESNNTDENRFVQNIGGTEIDIRRNSVPESYMRGRSIGSDDAAAINSTTAEAKGVTARASMPTGGGEYPYNPTYWNDAANVYRANCYGYVLNRIATDTKDPKAGYLFQPGYKTGNYYKSLTTNAIITAVKSDMAELGRTIRSSSYNEIPGSNEYKIALVIASNDYHWYRQDSDGGWSHNRD